MFKLMGGSTWLRLNQGQLAGRYIGENKPRSPSLPDSQNDNSKWVYFICFVSFITNLKYEHASKLQ